MVKRKYAKWVYPKDAELALYWKVSSFNPYIEKSIH